MFDPIKPMDFCEVSSRRGTKGSGLDVGETVLVASTKPLPEKRSDPYLQRVYAVVLRVTKDGDVLIPKDDNEYKSYLVDPRHLTRVSAERQEVLQELIGQRYEGVN